MCHALIIDDHMVISRAIGSVLTSLGCDSFDHTWNEEQTLAAAASRLPDLVVIGDSTGSGPTLAAARSVSARNGAPVLMITAEPCRMRQRFAEDTPFAGPFFLNDIEAAVALAGAAK